MDERITTRARVLVVDDDPDQLDLVRRTLAPHFDVQTHDSALGVSNLVRQGEPDLVLLDVNFPALKGDQVLTLARRYAPKGTKFILYSATDESRLRSLALAAGADGYLSKSIQGAELIQKLNAFRG
ncbi:Response regulator [Cystobacter fuscus DSM 2262]|jgi:DNA-binding response OmpR family regulator|uniref:Response regulator n=1 Tax=Cystobacter fuscus (strain ATCC 25194 / DSM 2262 / NBRC 100088 / M29) TaxID=1242864 RepID=S9QU33_CYSF2|nr:response regulator [Cystobacter fuscus]EPX60133.1 Response regulator [Cystobacter fuscus DSM 2262]WNG23507.1 response regulator [Cystobacter fuscus]